LHDLKIIGYGYSIGILPKLNKHPELYKYSNSFDLMVTDGRPFYFVAKLFGCPLVFDISIPNLSMLVLRLSNKYKQKVLLFGASQVINDKAVHNLRKQYPNANIMKGISGYFESDRETKIVNQINTLHPDVLLIGMQSPYKEFFAYKYKDTLCTKIIIPCGGMIEVFSGKSKPTPYWIKKIGLAWFFRFTQNPKKRFALTVSYLYYFLFLLLPLLCFLRIFRKDKSFSIANFFIKR